MHREGSFLIWWFVWFFLFPLNVLTLLHEHVLEVHRRYSLLEASLD